MFAISFIHRAGGTRTVLGKTLKEVRDKSLTTLNKDYIAATIPYAVYLAGKSSKIYECSIPKEILQVLGIDLRFLLKAHEDEQN